MLAHFIASISPLRSQIEFIARGDHDDAIATRLVTVFVDLGEAKQVAGIDDHMAELVGDADGDGEIELVEIARHLDVVLVTIHFIDFVSTQQESWLQTSLHGQTFINIVVGYYRNGEVV